MVGLFQQGRRMTLEPCKRAGRMRMFGVPAGAAHKHAGTHGILHLPSDRLLHILT